MSAIEIGMDWQLIGQVILGLSGGTAAIAFLARALIRQLLSRDLEQFKASLQMEHTGQAEKLRADLKAIAFERETMFSRLHQRRFEVIEELYRLLAQAQQAFAELVSPMSYTGGPSQEDKMRAAGNSGAEFLRFFDQHRLFLEDSLCEEITKLRNELKDIWITFVVYGDDDPDLRKEKLKKWKEAWEKMEKVVPGLRRDIEQKMRTALGITTR